MAHLLDGSGFETPTDNVKSKATWTLILINSAPGLLSNVILDQRNFFQSCDTCILCASLRSISVCNCRCTNFLKNLCSCDCDSGMQPFLESLSHVDDASLV